MSTSRDIEGFERKVVALITEASKSGSRKSPITKDAKLQRDLGIDSIGLLGLMMRFEEVFGISISDAQLEKYAGRVRTVGDLLTFGQELLQSDRANPAGSTES